ncbi:MAG TPA: hypothetical protein VIG33_07645 [Pseudobdellovibrionaceae bacterium]|jgi:hypothetical protein
MPYAAPLVDDENDPNKKSFGNPVNISGQSTTISTGIPGQDASSVPGVKQKTSGNYTNIQSYLDANKEQGDTMGAKIAGDVTSKADDATSKIGAYEAKAPSVQAYDPNEAISRATSLSDSEKAQYKTNKATGGYSGPQTADGIEGYQDANKAGTEAVAAIKNTGTERGQRELLKQTYNRPQYTAGENNLDQTLVQNSAGSKSRLEQIGPKYSKLSDYLSGANAKVGNAVNAANSQAFANKQAFIPAEQSARTALVSPIQARANQANQNNPAYINRVLDDASDNVISEETLKALGLNEGQDLFDMKLRDYVNQDWSPVGIDNAATNDERNKYAALNALFDDPTMNQLTVDGKAIEPVKLNKEKFDKDLAAKKAEYNDAYTNQRGTIFNEKYMPYGKGDVNQWIPGALTDRRDLSTATASELENYWFPLLDQAHQQAAAAGQAGAPGGNSVYSWAKNAMQQSLNDWKNAYQVNRKINKG